MKFFCSKRCQEEPMFISESESSSSMNVSISSVDNKKQENQISLEQVEVINIDDDINIDRNTILLQVCIKNTIVPN